MTIPTPTFGVQTLTAADVQQQRELRNRNELDFNSIFELFQRQAMIKAGDTTADGGATDTPDNPIMDAFMGQVVLDRKIT